MNTEKANLLLIEDAAKPLRSIQELARSLPEIESLDSRREFRSALDQLRSKIYQVILVTDRYPLDQRLEFTKSAKSTEGGKDSAFIVVLQSEAAAAREIAGKLLQGADGILQEPYSAEQLLDALSIAKKVQLQNMKARQRNAVDIALSDVMTYIEARTSNPNITFNKSLSKKALLNLKTTLRSLEEIDSEGYYEAVIEKFVALSSKERKLFEGGYRGASERVKKMMMKKAEMRVKEIAEQTEGVEDEGSSEE